MTPADHALPPGSDLPQERNLVLTINGGSSSIKVALFVGGERPKQIAGGQIEQIGQPSAKFRFQAEGKTLEGHVDATDHGQAAAHVLDWVGKLLGEEKLSAIAHRIVHGGLCAREHQRITPDLIAELRQSISVDLAHLPREIMLVEACGDRFSEVPQVACFDSAFHRSMPEVAQRLPIPRSYSKKGLRRLGFHGLSYTYLISELKQLDPAVVKGRVILAHLGSGASMAAVQGGMPVDTTMAFTPLAGLVMGTRPGDMDPGLLAYLVRTENWSPDELDDFLSRRCGMLGVSENSADMRKLLAAAADDIHAAQAVELFCYRARQWIGALAASMGGLDTLVFAGGIGENSPDVRERICSELRFLDIEICAAANATSKYVISAVGRRVTVRVIATDEESVMAKIAGQVINNME